MRRELEAGTDWENWLISKTSSLNASPLLGKDVIFHFFTKLVPPLTTDSLKLSWERSSEAVTSSEKVILISVLSSLTLDMVNSGFTISLPEGENPSSTVHSEEHPSPETLLPSSHSSGSIFKPSPQIGLQSPLRESWNPGLSLQWRQDLSDCFSDRGGHTKQSDGRIPAHLWQESWQDRQRLPWRKVPGAHSIALHLPPSNQKPGLQERHPLANGPEQVRQDSWQSIHLFLGVKNWLEAQVCLHT